MPARSIKRSTAQKLDLFRRCFSGLTHVYGTYDPRTGRVRQVKAPVTDGVFLDHLTGHRPYGVYLLVGDRTPAVVADFDTDDLSHPIEYVDQARHYGLAAYIERSKRKGYHAWIFIEGNGVPAAKARLVARLILDDMNRRDTEIFPKQDRLRGGYGNFINAPLFGRLVPQGRTVFVDRADPTTSVPDQWDYLEQVQRVGEATLDQIIAINDLGGRPETSAEQNAAPESNANVPCFGLPPCAQRMLTEGVHQYQRVACFRLALHLKKAGIPHDVARAALRTWATKNHPPSDKRIITPEEIDEQTQHAYEKSYRGCGCEDPAIQPFCDPSCRLYPNARNESAPETGTRPNLDT